MSNLSARQSAAAAFWFALMLNAVAFLSCTEEFPNYQEPRQVLSAKVLFQAPDTIDVVYDGLSLRYYLNSILTLKVEVTNDHDDLLQGKALIRGRIVLQSFAQTSRTFVVPLASGNLRSPTLFQGNIALGPARKAEFSELWVPYGTDGRIVFDGLPFRMEGNAELYGPIAFVGSAEVQMFERVQATRSGEISFARVFRLLRQ